jgi:biotin carboxylase
MCAAAAIRERFDLPGARLEVVESLTNKGRQRRSWTAAELPCPKWFLAKSAGEVPAALAAIDGTSIFKPVDSAGSRGVTVVEKGSSWNSAFEGAMNGSHSKEVIIEAFIVGLEHTVETFTNRGRTEILAITSKCKVPGTNNTVASELASAQLSPELRMKFKDIVTRALAALNYVDGPGHTELLLTQDKQVYLVETAGRGGGFMVADGIVPAVSGYDLATACALQAVGIEPPETPGTPPRAAVLRFIPSKRGKVLEIHGFGPDDDVSGVKSEPLVVVGQDVGQAVSDGDRMAYILASAETIEQAQVLANLKEARIRIVVA